MTAQSTASSAALKVILLKPSIVFQQIGGYAPKVPGGSANSVVLVGDQLVPIASYRDAVPDASRKALGSRVALVDLRRVEPSVVEECNKLERLSSELAAGKVTDEATERFARLGAIDERYAVLAQFLVVTQGPPSIDDQSASEVFLPGASGLLRAALLSAKTGKLIWKGQQLLRNKNRLFGRKASPAARR
jgi:hypothetical protein